MATTQTFTEALPGTYVLEDDGVPGNNSSQLRHPDGSVSVFPHPTDSLQFNAQGPGITLVVNLTDALGAASFTVGSLTDAAQTPDAILVGNLQTTGRVTLVAKGSITEWGIDAAVDIVSGSLVLSAVTGVGTPANPLELRANALEAETVTGGIALNSLSSLFIGGLTDQVNGLDVVTSGDLTLRVFGNIIFNEFDLDPMNAPAPPLQSVHGGNSSGNVTLIAIGPNADINAIVNLNAITAPAGSVVLQAGSDIVLGAGSGNDVRANGSITVTVGGDFIIDNGTNFISDAFGQNTGGGITLNAGRDVSLLQSVVGTAASLEALGNAGADVTITTGSFGALVVNSLTLAAIRSNSGDVTVNADQFILNSGGIFAPGGSVTIRPASPGRDIQFLADGENLFSMDVDEVELDLISTPNLIIGSANSGNIRIASAVTPAVVGNLTLIGGGDIDIAANVTLTGSGNSLTLQAAGNIHQTAGTITANALAATVDFTGDDPGVGGIATLNGTLSVTSNVINGNLDDDTLSGSNQANALFGFADSDTLRGFGGADFLDGGAGVDSMSGGPGNDTFIVGSSGDEVVEAAGEGSDTVYTTVSYTLAAGVEVETLAAQDNSLTVALNLIGNAFSNNLFGNNGVNFLDGGSSGADTLTGFGGNDVYVVDANDGVFEAAGGGNDTVYVRTSYTLAAGVEVETLAAQDSSQTFALDLIGNAFSNNLFGNNGANFLDGGGGIDTLRGFAGNDTYAVDDFGDVVFEAAGGGADTVFASTTYVLGAGEEIETLSARDVTATTALILVGNGIANTVIGNNGANLINGGGGSDVLRGFGSADRFDFTTALGAGNVDFIVDMVGGVDKIGLDDAIFTAIGPTLDANEFVVGSAALDADDRIIYNPATAQLFYDADGNGGGSAIHFATLMGAPVLTVSDFTVI